jgi:hypothetical protein
MSRERLNVKDLREALDGIAEDCPVEIVQVYMEDGEVWRVHLKPVSLGIEANKFAFLIVTRSEPLGPALRSTGWSSE